jgi:hypothetical protein
VSNEIAIRPEPSSEEAAAILAVIRLLRQRQPEALTAAAPSMSGWQHAARREALRTELPHGAGG